MNNEKTHKKLFQEIWPIFDNKSYEHLIKLTTERLKINKLDKLFKDKQCIDIGCGNGRFSIALARLGAKSVWGIDYGKKSIDFAQKKAWELGNRNVFFGVGSAYALDFMDGCLDIAISNGVFHHLDDPKKALQEAHRVLKPGGYLWISMQGKSLLTETWESARIALQDIPIKDTIKLFKKAGMETGKIYLYMDVFYAKYNCVEYKDLVKDLKDTGFGKIVKLKGSELDKSNSAEIRIWAQKRR